MLARWNCSNRTRPLEKNTGTEETFLSNNDNQTIAKETYSLTQKKEIGHNALRKAADPRAATPLPENERIVLEALRRVGEATRSNLVKLCALPRTTIYDVLIRLEQRGAVERYPEERTTRGRPKIFYRIP